MQIVFGEVDAGGRGMRTVEIIPILLVPAESGVFVFALCDTEFDGLLVWIIDFGGKFEGMGVDLAQ